MGIQFPKDTKGDVLFDCGELPYNLSVGIYCYVMFEGSSGSNRDLLHLPVRRENELAMCKKIQIGGTKVKVSVDIFAKGGKVMS